MSDYADRKRIMRKIERVFLSFQQVLKAGIRPTFFLPESESEQIEVLELNSRNPHRFLFVSQILLNVYVLLKTNTYRTKRDLFYEFKNMFVSQSTLDDTVCFITRLLQENRLDLHILATSKGLVMGDLSFKNEPAEESAYVRCNDAPVSVPILPNEITELRSGASFILLAEKDAIFQNLVDEKFCTKLGPCILITAKGYPDYATRVFLYRLHTELNLPVYALMDGDAYGIDIYLMYKYGPMLPQLFDATDTAIESLIWIGVYPTEASRMQLDDGSKLAINEREREKASQLLRRANVLGENFIGEQLNHLLNAGFKMEIEAVATVGPNYLTDSYLSKKLEALLRET